MNLSENVLAYNIYYTYIMHYLKCGSQSKVFSPTPPLPPLPLSGCAF